MCVCMYVCMYVRSEEHTSELQSHLNLVCRLLLERIAAVAAAVVRVRMGVSRGRRRCGDAPRVQCVAIGESVCGAAAASVYAAVFYFLYKARAPRVSDFHPLRLFVHI